MTTNLDPQSDLRLHCRTCNASFVEMRELLRHREHCPPGEPDATEPKDAS